MNHLSGPAKLASTRTSTAMQMSCNRTPAFVAALSSQSLAANAKHERLDKDKACLLVVDLQEGLFQLARDEDAITVKSNILAHSELARVFHLPTILTTSDENGLSIFPADIFTAC